jgi:hypothetical protein
MDSVDPAGKTLELSIFEARGSSQQQHSIDSESVTLSSCALLLAIEVMFSDFVQTVIPHH